jgi:hypothetical protein
MVRVAKAQGTDEDAFAHLLARTSLRITAYHMVVASPVPWIRCQGLGGRSSSGAMPASTSWRWVAT